MYVYLFHILVYLFHMYVYLYILFVFRDSPAQLELELPVVQIVQVVRALFLFSQV